MTRRGAAAGRSSWALPGLRADTLALLEALPDPIPEPVRAELFGTDRFRQHGISLARAQPVDRRRHWRRRVRTPPFFPRIAANLRGVERARAYLEVSDRESEVLRPAAEWLLDNFHLIEAQVPEIRNDLPAGYYATLPKLRDQPLIGLPRVYGIAWAFVAHTDSSFDASLLTQLLEAYQEVDTLTLGELWAVPASLRVVLLENLARLAETAACHQAAQEAADLCCDQQDSVDPATLDALFGALDTRRLASVFLAQMIARLRSHVGGEAPPWAAWLSAKAPDPGALLAQVHAMHAANNVSVSNAVTALHAINNLSWKPLIDRVSPVVQMLRQSPAFAADSELTQDQCTHAVERFARRLNCSESEVARHVIDLAAVAGDPVAIEGGPAHWLIGDGRADLVRALGGPDAPLERPVPRWLNRARGALYAGALIVGTLLLLSAATGEQSWRHLSGLAALALASLAAFECAASIVNRILAETVRVHRLPRIALDNGLQAEHRTLVVIPCLLSSAADAASLAHRLEQHYLANPEAHTRYALLSDWPDAPARDMDGDDALLAAARDAIERLNRRHPVAPGEPHRFALLHRARTWSQGENVWMGWERKRGKLEQLVAALADPAARAASPFFDLGELSRLRDGVRYVVTLDSDTVMPPGVLRTMVAIAAHPLNRPRFDPKTRRVVAGYGILQPGIAAPLPSEGEVTAFGWLFSGPWGFDVYNEGSSEIFQDVFGQGRFSGKGLLDVHAIHQSLGGRVPENSLLSHDLYEGVWARTAHLSDVQLVESAPMHPDVAASRLHRWTRGDWQLLPLIGPSLRGRVGALNLWKMFDNLRRSLLAPASLLLLWLCMATDALDPWTGLGLTAAAFGLGPVIGALAGLLPPRRDLALRHFVREGLRDLGRALGGTLWQLLTLPQAAARETDAIVRALWRMLVSRRRLLEWTTAAQAQAASRLDLGGFWRRHFGVTLLSIAWVATGVWLPDAHGPWLVGIGSLWALTPLWFWGGSQALRPRDPHLGLSAAERHELRQLAQDTWRLFETIVTPDEHHLPPDNLQLDPEPIVAHRTSPTNVGLYLCSCVCAHRFEFIDTRQLTERLEATLATLVTLPRWHGHFDNWIETTRLQPLTPRYISTVDSGNLVACLWTVAQACRETAARAPRADADAAAHQALSARLRVLADRLIAIADETDFSVLYDRRRRLFYIGYRQDDARMDPAHYDLLASESRLASYVAIAKGDVPLAHWSALGRPFLGIDGEPALRSWSGSMFEYLMPSLLMREPRRSLLQRVSVAAVQAQRSFGARQGVPWGVSESAYFEQDPSLAFQYGPFGVPQLALRRTPVDDLVIAPYASVLALLVDPVAALANLRELERIGARDRYGFIDALDFSPARRGDTGRVQRVATVMAHHQGMSLLSLCDVLCDDNPRGWFERIPRAQAFDTLLHERLPRAIVFQSRAIPRRARDEDTRSATLGARLLDPASAPAAALPTALIGNGRYSVCLGPNGAGHSRWQGRAITRTREDRLRDAHGHWMLLRTGRDAPLQSLTLAPCPAPEARYQTRFLPNQVDFEAVHPAWESTLSVWVSPDDDVELRRVVLHNLGDRTAEFELTSLFEVVLAPQEADESHPAFSNLFVTAHAMDPACILFERRPRRQAEQGLCVVHFLAASDVDIGAVQLSCDRAQVLPRNGHVGQAAFGRGAQARRGDVLDTGLDPVASLTVRLRIPPHAHAHVTLATAAAPDPHTLMALVDEYRQEVHLTRSRRMSETLARIRQRELQLTAATIQLAQDLTTQVTIAPLAARKAPEVALDRRALWRFATSGDRPIVLVRIDNVQGLRNVRALLTVHRIWQFGDLVVDLLIVNSEPASYLMPLQRRLIEAFAQVGVDPDDQADRGQARILRASELSPREWAALRACARIELVADGRPLERLAQAHVGEAPEAALPCVAPAAQAHALWPQALARGDFGPGGLSFDLRIDAHHHTPKPWANVMANPQFGCIVTESGGGHTWAVNSRLNQLTAWSNDPLLDPPAEQFLVHDSGRDEVFGLLPTLDRNGRQGYEVSHRAGMSLFTQERAGLAVETCVMVHPHEALKCLRVRLHNHGSQPRQLRMLGLVEWVLGAQRRDRLTLATEYVANTQTVLARQLEHSGGHGEGTAFLMLAGLPVDGWTCARQQFFDARGQLQWPNTLSRAHGFGLDPCGALSSSTTLAPGATLEFFWVLGFGPVREASLALAGRMAAPGVLAVLADQVAAHWDALLSPVQVETPDPLFDALVNRWLPYQILSCRLWAKAGYYQVGGATGFRDQLQDGLAFAATRPSMLREQLLRHASRQFDEGDVQHWWHDPTGAGVRTHSSDDLLWLPYATTHYLAATDDQAVLDEPVGFLNGSALGAQVEDVYEVPTESSACEPLYEHGARAIDHALRLGAHGLPLMGGGDWNDGMNMVGHEGRGESVWLGWFLLVILRDWLPIARQRRDEDRASRWDGAIPALERALAHHGWDGAWYRRAYFDNGHALGSSQNDECRIDLIAQAWSVFASPPGDARAAQAMRSADAMLVDRDTQLVRLLDPPLQRSADHAGYIQAYPPGVRENGGQYTHAAVWALMAQARLGDAERVWAYFCMVSPAHRARTPEQRRRYAIEPYVLPGDTYSAAPHAGRGGWSWYSGSAAWLHRAAVESMFGLTLRHDRLCLRPALPPHWPRADLTLRLPHRTLTLRLRRRGAPAPGSGGRVRPIRAGEWVDLADLADDEVLQLNLPAAALAGGARTEMPAAPG